MDIKTLQKDIHENAISKGWWETKRPIPELLCLIHSEATELFHAMSKDEGFPNICEEAADIVIRTLDMADGYGYRIDLEEFLNPMSNLNFTFAERYDWQQWLLTINSVVSACLESYRKGQMVIENIEAIIVSVFGFSEVFGIDIIESIKTKHEENKKRPYRHGNKIC